MTLGRVQIVQRTLRCQYEIPSSPRISPECKDMLVNLIVKVLTKPPATCALQKPASLKPTALAHVPRSRAPAVACQQPCRRWHALLLQVYVHTDESQE